MRESFQAAVAVCHWLRQCVGWQALTKEGRGRSALPIASTIGCHWLCQCRNNLTALFLLTTFSLAADRVTIRPEDSAGLMVVTGDIRDYDDEFLTLRSGPRTNTYPASQVAAVEAFRTPEQLRGEQLYQQGRIDEAIAQFELALASEQRRWLRRDIRAGLVRCHKRQGRLRAAARYFVEIIEDEPHTRHWGIAPLIWTPATVPDNLLVDARRWVVAQSEAVRLIGASLLLPDAATRLNGIAELHKLERSQDRYVGNLAQAQLWLATLDTNVTSTEELRRWQHDIERMPESIRGGPWYALGQARLHRREPDAAAAALLRVLIVHDADPQLAARSGLEAALALKRINRDDEARKVFEEVAQRFSWTPSAAEARQHIQPTQP